MKTRNIPGLSRLRVRSSPADLALLAERIHEAHIVGQDEVTDFILLRPAELDELLEDAAAAAAFARTRDQESLPAAMVDRLLTGDNPVKVWREHRGLTLTGLAKMAGIGKGYLSQIENAARAGTVETMQKLATALSVDLDDLVPTDRGDD